ncbi:MAG TPA: hypothetical protein PLC44_00030 [Saprospiraceae bacterium]|nr:hypothetical protein [Saprospiraceae bacterium]HNO16663.1 hypothetical protein [Saprospiraceae bacterium]
MRHQWTKLHSAPDGSGSLHECDQCKVRRHKYLLNGSWEVRYFRDRSMIRRFAPDCIPKSKNQSHEIRSTHRTQPG